MFRRRREQARLRDAARKGAERPAPAPAAERQADAAAAPPALPKPDLVQLEAEARHHRDRLSLYRARVNSSKPSSPERLRELERASTAADERLRHARRS